MTRLRHMWSGPPMSPSPMSPFGAMEQIWGLSSLKPNRYLQVFGPLSLGGSWCNSSPWTLHWRWKGLWRSSLLAAQVGLGNMAPMQWVIQGGRGKTKIQWPKVSCSGGVLVHQVVFKVELLSVYLYTMPALNHYRLQGLFFHQGGPIVMVQVLSGKYDDMIDYL